MIKDHTVDQRVIRIESKLSRFISEQEDRNHRLDRFLGEWEEFKKEWDEAAEEDTDVKNTGNHIRDAANMPGSIAERRS